MGRSPVGDAWRSIATASICGEVPDRVGAPYGTQTRAGAEDVCGIGCFRLG